MSAKYLALVLSTAEACTGPNCWSCDAPLEATECVKSSWTGWKSDFDEFQAKCDGNLVRWGDDSGVQDCGQACFACSYIRACCDTCKTILSVEGTWERIRCSDVEIDVTYEWGVQTTESSSWSRTEEWSQAVSAKASASYTVGGFTGGVELSAEARHSLTEVSSSSWSQTTTEKTTETYTQPASTCSWTWKTTITDSCGVKIANSRDFILTSGPSRGNTPCCLPGIDEDEDGNCMPNAAGEVISLCGGNLQDGQALV